MVYFNPGDIVQLQEWKVLENCPEVMFVTRVVKSDFNETRTGFKNILLGIEVAWFKPDMSLEKLRLSSKDLQHYIRKED